MATFIAIIKCNGEARVGGGSRAEGGGCVAEDLGFPDFGGTRGELLPLCPHLLKSWRRDRENPTAGSAGGN